MHESRYPTASSRLNAVTHQRIDVLPDRRPEPGAHEWQCAQARRALRGAPPTPMTVPARRWLRCRTSDRLHRCGLRRAGPSAICGFPPVDVPLEFGMRGAPPVPMTGRGTRPAPHRGGS